MSRLKDLSLGRVGGSIEYGAITGTVDYLDFGGDGDGDGDGDSAEVELSLANGTADQDFPANATPLYAYWNLDAVFAGGTIDSAVITMGDTANPDQISGETPINVFTGQALGPKYSAGDDNATDGAKTFEAAYTPVARITTGTEPPAGLTAGRIRYVLVYEKPVF